MPPRVVKELKFTSKTPLYRLPVVVQWAPSRFLRRIPPSDILTSGPGSMSACPRLPQPLSVVPGDPSRELRDLVVAELLEWWRTADQPS